MGTPDFAVPTLAEIVGRGHEVAAVYTRAAKPAGRRGLELQPTPVEREARRFGLEVLTPATLRNEAAQAAFRAHNADAAVVVAYGLILPKPILDAVPLGCFNLHASLLPRWRGAAPIQRAIMAGDANTGVTIMQMAEGLDTGPMVLKEELAIGAGMNAGGLHDALAEIGARLICQALDQLPDLKPGPQPVDGVTYAAKITKEECRIDWRRSASELDRHIRGLSPAPGAFTEIGGERLTILAADPVAGSDAAGTTIDDRLTIACGEGALRPTLVKRAGKRAMSVEEMLRGFAVPKGTALS